MIDSRKCFATVDESISATVVLRCRPPTPTPSISNKEVPSEDVLPPNVGRMDRRRSSPLLFDEGSRFYDNDCWGFRITGGCEFGMPITVFQVMLLLTVELFYKFGLCN